MPTQEMPARQAARQAPARPPAALSPPLHPSHPCAAGPQLQVAPCYVAEGRDLSPHLKRLPHLQTLQAGSMMASRSGWGNDAWDNVYTRGKGAAVLRSFRLAASGPPRLGHVNMRPGAAWSEDGERVDELARELALCESADLHIDLSGPGPEGVPPPPPEWPFLALGRMLRAAPALAGTLVSLRLTLRVDREAALGVAAPLLAQPLPRLRELLFYCGDYNGAVQAGDVAALAQLRAPHLCHLSLPFRVAGGHEAVVAAATAVCMALPRPPLKGAWWGGDGFLHIRRPMLTVQEAETLVAALDAAGRGWVRVQEGGGCR
jgi:hypothetical protein